MLLAPNPARRLRLLCNYSLLRVKANFLQPEPRRRVFYSLTPCGVLASPLPLWESIGRLRRPFLEKDAEAKVRLRRIDRCDPGEGLRPIDRPYPLTPTLSRKGGESALPPSRYRAKASTQTDQMLVPDSIFKRARKPMAVIPGWSAGPGPESRDSGFDASHRPGMTESGSLRSQ